MIDILRAENGRRTCNLATTCGIEWDISVALESILDIPICLAMSHDDQALTHEIPT